MHTKHTQQYNGYAVQPSAHRLPDGCFSSNLLLERTNSAQAEASTGSIRSITSRAKNRRWNFQRAGRALGRYARINRAGLTRSLAPERARAPDQQSTLTLFVWRKCQIGRSHF
jgi:hypothetical protein